MSLFVSAVDTVNWFMLSGRFYCSETPCTFSMYGLFNESG